MNHAALLALIGDLYDQLAMLRGENARLTEQLAATLAQEPEPTPPSAGKTTKP